MPQHITTRAFSELVCRNLTRERVQLGVPQHTHNRPKNKDKEKGYKQSLLIASLNIRGK